MKQYTEFPQESESDLKRIFGIYDPKVRANISKVHRTIAKKGVF